MAIEDHDLRRPDSDTPSLNQLSYINSRAEGLFTNASEALDYIFNTIYPNWQGNLNTTADLPVTGNPGDYYFIRDDGDGRAAGYQWQERDGSGLWRKIFDVDWSTDGILADFQNQIDPEYATILGKEGGQRLAGGINTGENLELEANSADGTGQIIIHNDIVPNSNESLGTALLPFLDLHLSGTFSDGTNTVSIAQIYDAVTHAALTGSNPHNTSYTQLSNLPGTLTVDGDVATQNVDLGTGGNKSLNISVNNDSHNHSTSTITDFFTSVYNAVKSILVDGDGVAYTDDDGLETISPSVNADTSNISDVASPAVNRVLASNAAGDEWVAGDLNVELTGDVVGTGSFNSATQRVQIPTTVSSTSLGNITDVSTQNITYTSVLGNPTTVTSVSHGLSTSEFVRFYGTELTGVHQVTRIDDDTFSVAVDTASNDSGYYIPEDAHLDYDPTLDIFKVSKAGTEVRHERLKALTNDDHPQYNLIAGRGNGTSNQVTGGSDSNGNLYLQSTSQRSAPGDVVLYDPIRPETDSISASATEFSGVTLGRDNYRFADVYTRGRFYGLRLEEVATLPATGSSTKGRMLQLPDGKVYVSDGANFNYLWTVPSLSGSAGYVVSVNSSEDGLELQPTNAGMDARPEQSIINTGNITLNSSLQQVIPVSGDSAARTTSTTPFGTTAPTNGTAVTLYGTSDTNTVTIPGADIQYGCLLDSDTTLALGESLTLIYSSPLERYVPMSGEIQIEGENVRLAGSTQEFHFVGAGNAGESLTNTQAVPYIHTEGNSSLWDGTTFTADRSALYSVSGGAFFGGNRQGVYAMVNISRAAGGNDLKSIGHRNSNTENIHNFSGEIWLNAGDSFYVYLPDNSATGYTVSNSAVFHNISIAPVSTTGDIVYGYTSQGLVSAAVEPTSSGMGVTAGQPVKWGTVTEDTQGIYNPITGEFTIPTSGLYQLNIVAAATSTAGTWDVFVNGTQKKAITSTSNSGTNPGSMALPFAGGDVLTIRCDSTITLASVKNNSFSIYLVR